MSVSDPPPLITECPNCNTRFRVGESQLQMAHGRVRCGACLAVFAGVDHLLLDESSPPPELPDKSDALDSVLAELQIDAEPVADPDADAEEIPEDHDWTSVSVDTQEFGRDLSDGGDSGSYPDNDQQAATAAATAEPATARPASARASIEDALNDEEALRWWLEDELPGESGLADEQRAEDFGDGMVVQLSHLDAVQEEELDLRSLIATAEDNTSARELEELFEEDALESEPQDAVNIEPLAYAQPKSTPEQSRQRETETDSGVSADELQTAIDEAEPLVSRAMANGTIAAAAERMSATAARQNDAAREQAPEQISEKDKVDASETVALVTSPHRAARRPGVANDSSEVSTDNPLEKPLEKPVDNSVEQLAGDSADLAAASIAGPKDDPWNSAHFPETPAESVADITEEMAAAGTPVVERGPSIFERLKTSVDGFLGHALALRIATILAFVLLSAQVLYWQFDDWSKTSTMRPVYANLCSLLGCELPARRSVRDLQSRKLAVRSHPEKSDALLVDALIINEANFEQPFPVIELQFMDISQQLVGSYRLEPSMYLDGELAGSDALMPVRTPVHVDIDIPDPGPKAVNYQLQFR